jgi:hypothetical protein
MQLRKLTLEVIVDQDNTADWDWIYKPMLSNKSVNGLLVRGIANEHRSEELSKALIESNNMAAEYKRELEQA